MTDPVYCQPNDITLSGNPYYNDLDRYLKCLWDNNHPPTGNHAADGAGSYWPVERPAELNNFGPTGPTLDFAKWWSNYGSWILITVLVLIVTVTAIVVNNKTKKKDLTSHVN